MMPFPRSAAIAMDASAAAAMLAKATVVTAAAMIAVRCMGRSRAAARHALLTAGFAALALLPIASVSLPAIRVRVPGVPAVLAFSAPSSGAPVEPAPAGLARLATGSTSAIASRPSFDLPLATLSMVVYVSGALLSLMPVLAGLAQMRFLRRTARPWREGQSAADAIAVAAGVRRRVEIVVHESLPGPVTCGVWRSTIALPGDARTWNTDDLGRAITHELEHVRRGDWLTQCLARMVCACYWFHPLVWAAWRQLALEAERACDDAVLTRARVSIQPGTESEAYADQLVGLAQRLSTRTKPPLPAMASRHDLAARVGAVLDSRQRRGRAGVLVVAAVSTGCLAVVAAVSPLRMIGEASAASTAQDVSDSAALRFEVVSVKPCSPAGAGGAAAASGGAPASGAGTGGSALSHGKFRSGCSTVAQLIQFAYVMFGESGARAAAFKPLPIDGAPNWLSTERYQIEAEAAGDPPASTMRGPMMRAVLEDRFHLKIRRETRDAPVYALTVAPGGAKLQPFEEGSCDDRDPTQPLPQAAGAGKPVCGLLTWSFPAPQTHGNWIIQARGTTVGRIAGYLDQLGLDRPVIDRTGLTGDKRIDLRLEFARDDTTPGLPPPIKLQEGASDPSGPSLFSAVQRQLGLKLTATKGPSPLLVIDHVERPAPNEAAPAARR